MNIQIAVTTLLLSVLSVLSGEEGSVSFIKAGRAVSVHKKTGKWSSVEGALSATGKSAKLIAGLGLGEGDFTVVARLRLMKMKGSAASLMLGDNHFGFEGAHGKMFLTGPLFKARGLPIGEPSKFMKDGELFVLEAKRIGELLTFSIDGNKVHELKIGSGAIGRIALLPWRSAMQVETLTASGNLSADLADAPKPEVYRTKEVAGVEKIRLLPPRTGNPRNSEGDFIRLKDGRLLFVYTHFFGGGGDHSPARLMFDGRGVISCYLSDDGGASWRQSKTTQKGNSVTLQEPGVVELKDGRLMMFCRTSSGSQYVSYSSDGADTWSPFKSSNILSPRSPATVERIPETGDLLLIWNNHENIAPELRGRRTPFNVAISKDEGVTWQNVKTLEDDPNGWYCYTALEFVDGFVLLGHCAGDRRTGGLNTTQITRFPVKWLYEEMK